MQVKLFEVKDRCTTYSVMAVKHVGETAKEQWLLNRVGLTEGNGYPVQLTNLEGGETKRDAWKWVDEGRTLVQAHLHIIKAWDTLNSGDVIDVEYLLDEVDQPRESGFKDQVL
jgi:hypothetical protein